jgi:hypothetical protein
MLPIILGAAQMARDECRHIQDVPCGMLTSQGFFATRPSSGGAYASQAKNTIAKYKEGASCKHVKL